MKDHTKAQYVLLLKGLELLGEVMLKTGQLGLDDVVVLKLELEVLREAAK